MSERSLREEIRDLVDELTATKAKLAAANERIRQLEDELSIWRAGCERVQAELRAEQEAGQWEPVHPGFHYLDNETEMFQAGNKIEMITAETFVITNPDESIDLFFDLPSDIRLCRRRPQETPS